MSTDDFLQKLWSNNFGTFTKRYDGKWVMVRLSNMSQSCVWPCGGTSGCKRLVRCCSIMVAFRLASPLILTPGMEIFMNNDRLMLEVSFGWFAFEHSFPILTLWPKMGYKEEFIHLWESSNCPSSPSIESKIYWMVSKESLCFKISLVLILRFMGR